VEKVKNEKRAEKRGKEAPNDTQSDDETVTDSTNSFVVSSLMLVRVFFCFFLSLFVSTFGVVSDDKRRRKFAITKALGVLKI
jgi:hypothetical protein